MPLKLNSTGGGSVSLDAPSTASTFTLTLPAANATVATTTGTLTNPTINGFTGDTSVINVGSGQFYKDASGNVGIGQTPTVYGATVRNVEAYIAGASAFTLVSANTANVKTEITASESSLLGQVGTRTNHPFLLKVNDTERMRIDTSGNVGIGTSSPATKLDVRGTITSNTSTGGTFNFNSTAAATSNTIGSYANNGNDFANLNVSTSNTIFLTSGTERVRITSGGDFCVGTNTPTAGARFTAFSAGFQTTMSCLYNGTDQGTPVIRTYHQATSGSARLHIYFTDGTTNGVGSITSNGTSTAYNTSSDYRLKEDVQPMDNGLAIVTALKPVTYTWKADGSRGEGFIAHELAEHVPLAVIGEKDAVDSDGAIKAQAVDYSKLVVHLVAAIQEQQAQIESLTARIAQLEAK